VTGQAVAANGNSATRSDLALRSVLASDYSLFCEITTAKAAARLCGHRCWLGTGWAYEAFLRHVSNRRTD
jgi:hypothetical protein